MAVAGRRGFTLVELLLVLGICSLIISFSLSTLSNFTGKVYLEATARLIASELRSQQAKAESRGETQAWSVSSLPMPPGISARSIKEFKYAKSGFPPPGGTGTQLIEDRHGASRQIVLSSAGRVRIE